jgi:hypothetical protein
LVAGVAQGVAAAGVAAGRGDPAAGHAIDPPALDCLHAASSRRTRSTPLTMTQPPTASNEYVVDESDVS